MSWQTDIRFPHKHILLVDDCEYTIDLLEDFFLFLGCEVEIDSNGTHATGLCKKNRYDLIVMDLDIEKKHGLDICREIRKIGTNKLTPIIIFSVGQPGIDPERCLEAGANEFIYKPFSLDKFVIALKKYLRRD